jgi:hypothetical protein
MHFIYLKGFFFQSVSFCHLRRHIPMTVVKVASARTKYVYLARKHIYVIGGFKVISRQIQVSAYGSTYVYLHIFFSFSHKIIQSHRQKHLFRHELTFRIPSAVPASSWFGQRLEADLFLRSAPAMTHQRRRYWQCWLVPFGFSNWFPMAFRPGTVWKDLPKLEMRLKQACMNIRGRKHTQTLKNTIQKNHSVHAATLSRLQEKMRNIIEEINISYLYIIMQ